MAYKKFITRGGKIYGPYVYHSRKEGGKVITEYRGKSEEKKPISPLGVISVFGFVALLLIFGLFFMDIAFEGETSLDELNIFNPVEKLYHSVFPVEQVGFSPQPFVVDHNNVGDFDSLTQEQLDRVRELNWLWGHQSVGEIMMMGLNDLELIDPVKYGINIVPSLGPSVTRQNYLDYSPLFGHVGMYEFWAFANANYDLLDVAMMKYCYVNLDGVATAQSVFQQYKANVDAFKLAHPGVILIHYTIPLTTDVDFYSSERSKYRDLILAEYGDEYVYDLADLESWNGTGYTTFNYLGTDYIQIDPSHTGDGGHPYYYEPSPGVEPFNRELARAWWVMMARVAEDLVTSPGSVTYSNYDGSTTDFNAEPDIANVPDAIIEDTTNGMINFQGQTLDFTGADLDRYVFIEEGLIGIDTNVLPSLDAPAQITFRNIAYSNPVIYRDGVECTTCSIVSYSGGDLVVSVPGFSTYIVGEREGHLTCADIDTTGYSNGCQLVSSCGTLAQSNTYYLLTNNVVSDWTCFPVEASNIVIDLNQYIATYGNSTPVVVPNAGFESGTSNWDFTNAPNVEVTTVFPETIGSWIPDEVENNVLKYPAGTNNDVVYSEYVSVTPGEGYILSLLVYEQADQHGTLSISIDGGVGCTVVSGAWGGSDYWSADRCTFIATTTQVRVKISRVSQTSYDTFLDAVMIKPSALDTDTDPGKEGHHGVMPNIYNLHDLRVTNGNIIQGQEAGMFGNVVRLDGVNGEADHLDIVAHGADTKGIITNGGDYAKIHHNNITLNGKRTHNSHDPEHMSEAIYLDYSEYSQVYENNILRAPGTGIGGSYDNFARYSEIFNNTINIDSSSIHCYALGMPTYGKVYNNFVNNTRGGGISSDASFGTEVYDNYFEVRDGPQAERGWTTKGIWTRYDSGGFDIHDNIFIGYAGVDFPNVGEESSLAGVRIGGYDDSKGPLKFYNNYVEARTNFKGADSKGVALDLNTDDYIRGGVTKYIYNNTFVSNHWLVVLGDTYGISGKSFLENNTFIKAFDADSIPGEEFLTIYHGFDGSHGTILLDSLFQGGANFDQMYFVDDTYDENIGQIGHRIVNISWTLTTNILDSGVLANNARIEIWDAIGQKVEDTYVDGISKNQLVEREYGGQGSFSTLMTLTTHSPYTVNVTYLGETQSQIINLDTSKEINFNFISGPDVYPPTRNNPQPQGNLPAGTTQAFINLTTNEAATCKYGTTSQTYVNLPNTFSTTGGTTHNQLITNLQNGNSYTYYVRCVDGLGNENDNDFTIDFTVDVTVGTLSVVHNGPANNSAYNDGQSFTYTTTLSCNGGDCGDVVATLDPLVSQGQPAYASSNEFSFPAGQANDGNLATRWASGYSINEWWYVDLGQDYLIDQVIIYWEVAYGRGYQIQVSDDAVSWTPVFTEVAGNGGTDDISFTPLSARYVRMYGEVAPYGSYSMWEFEVYGDLGGPQSSAKSGAIPEDSGSPFYTTSNNPQTCTNLLNGQNCVLNWNVVVNESLSSDYDFFVIYDAVNPSVEDVNSPVLNISVTNQIIPMCDLTNASWSVTGVANNTPVELILDGTDCAGEMINFTIYEYDFIGSDEYVISVVDSFDRTNWNALWQAESFPENNPPEFYFQAFVVSNPTESINSRDVGNDMLNVYDSSGTENEIFIEPALSNVVTGESFLVEVRGKAPFSASDVYGVQYDVIYDPNRLAFNSIVEGPLLSNNWQDSTVFNYTSAGSGMISNVYNSRNGTQQGVYTDEGIFAVINFSGFLIGESDINISDLIWVNSSITNESVGTPNVIITQGSVIVSGVSSCTDFDTDGYNTTTGGICGVIADCNDTNTAVNPGATEVCTDGIDNNCNGESGYDGSDGMHGDSVCVISFFNTGILPEFTFASVVENTQFDFRCFIDPIMQTLNDVVYADFDGNSCSFDKWQTYAYYFTCNSGSYTGSNKTARCFINDTNSYYTGFQSVSLEFEVTQTPPNCIDNDGDGYNTTASAECGLIDEIDCDDNNINVNPGAIEVCDGVDNDCQGVDSNPNGICTYLSNLEPDAFICVLGVCECSTTYEEDNPELAWINGANCNGCVDQTEITNYANDWLNGESEIGQIEITTAVDNWINVVSSCP